MNEGLLIIGHGSREARGVKEFHELVALFKQQQSNREVEPCFLELAHPTVETGVTKLLERGARRITVVPLILFAAGHSKRDIPHAVDSAIQKNTGDCGSVELVFSPPLGCHPKLVELSFLRFNEAIFGDTQRSSKSHGNTNRVLLMVGRGSSDSSAIAAAEHFLSCRRQTTRVKAASVCYLAMARPTLDEALGHFHEMTSSHVIVQPHLLFDGQLLDRLKARVELAQRRMPQHRWTCTAHLGVHSLLVEALQDLATNPQGVRESV